MLKHNEYDSLHAYMHMLFGTDVSIREYVLTNNAPLYLVDGYRFLFMTIQESTCIIMEPRSQEYRLPTLVKHLAKASQVTGITCALLLPSLRSQQRKALIQQRVPFLVPGSQLYLLFTGCMFTEKLTHTHLIPEAMAPATQLVFLYLYYRESASAVSATELARQLKLSKATLTRAMYSLQQLGLACTQSEGTKKLLTLPTISKSELLQAAKPYLQSPVGETIYLSDKPENALLGGLLALSSHTMLSSTSLDGAYVITKREAKHLESQKISKQDFLDFGGYLVEVYKYDPALLATGKTVDAISLLLSFKAEYDERTQQALEILKERVLW